MDSNINLDEYIDFHKYWLVLKRRWIPATATCFSVVALSAVIALSLEKVYETEAQLLIKTDRSAQLTGLQNEIGEIEVLTYESDPIGTQADILRSRPVVQKAIEELDLRDEQGNLYKYKDIVDSLAIKPNKGTYVLTITYQNSDPELAASIVNKIVEIYQQKETESNRSEASAARKFIAGQLPGVENNVNQAEAELRRFKNQNRVANLSEETTTLIEATKSLENEIEKVTAQLKDLNARYNRLNAELGMNLEEASAISALSESIAVQRALEELQEVKVRLANQQNYFAENTPQIISLKEQEDKLTNLVEQQIRQTLGTQQAANLNNINILSIGQLKQDQIAQFSNLGIQKEGLEQKLAAFKNTYTDYQQRLSTLPELEKQQRELERRVQASQSTYQTLLSKLQETQVAEQQNVANSRVVANAVVPDEPVGPRRKLIIAAGGFLGASLGVASAFLLDLRDNTIKNSKEAEQVLGYPLQGVIPDFTKTEINEFLAEDLVLDLPQLNGHGTPSVITREAYQVLQANLKLLKTDKSKQVIAISSSVSQEGKSYVSANLAIAKAELGKRILLIDADMRRPKQHLLWNIPNQQGLSDVLAGKIEWEQAIQQVMTCLDVLPSGKVASNPVSLIDSERMQNLIATASKEYDYIIFDTPPLNGMADSRILGKMVDGLLVVIRPDVADYASVMAVKKLLESTDQNVLGIVVNGVNPKDEPYGYGYHYYPDKKYLEASSTN
ncbi:MAG: GumC family protein [Pleurocapsa sp.]